MSAASRKSPRDATGRNAVKLAEENAELLAERAGQISTLNPMPEVVFKDDEPEDADGVLKVGSTTRRLRVNTDLEDIVVGQGNYFTFLRGREYTVPAHVYDHLEEKGYVYH
ncbi:hypothetical protein GCM10010149_89400 [Nonomuraea roseoviolacea subsp. roseoviolacea]|uniref:hypothetical protein n=1 Tax=Nonomuraea roseoviolacea TaxID=103837 RepID=UPI0031D36534